MLEDCDEENSSEGFSLADDANNQATSNWPANINLNNGIKK